MKIIRLKRNLLKVSCNTCTSVTLINKYSKKEISCSSCTSTLTVPKGNKCEVLHK